MTTRFAIGAALAAALTLAPTAAARLVPSKGKPQAVVGQAGAVAVSPDGKNVYVAAPNTGALTIFARDRSGKLRRLRGANGCFTRRKSRSRCRVDRSVAPAFSIVVSPDGRNVYAGGISRLVTFARNTHTGALKRVGTALEEGDAPTVSPDGRHVYAGSTTYLRDPSTGALAPGPATTITMALPSPASEQLALTRDGQFAYLLQTSRTSNVAVISLARDPATGALTQLAGGCLQTKPEVAGCGSTGWAGTATPGDLQSLTWDGADIAVTPDGATVLAVINEGDGGERSTAGLGVLNRDPATGLITPAPPRLQDGDGDGSFIDGASGFALSPDGKTIFLASDFDASIRTLELGAGGQVRTRQCFLQFGGRSCTQLRRMDFPAGIAVSPNGRSVYVANAANLLVFTNTSG